MSELTSELLMTAEVKRVGNIPENRVSNTTARQLVASMAVARKRIPIPYGWERNPQVSVMLAQKGRKSGGIVIHMITGKEKLYYEKQKVMIWEVGSTRDKFGAFVAMHSHPTDIANLDLIGLVYDGNTNVITLNRALQMPLSEDTEELLLLVKDGLLESSTMIPE